MCDFTSLGLASAAVLPWGAPAGEVQGWRFRWDTDTPPHPRRDRPGRGGGFVLIRERAPSYLQCL